MARYLTGSALTIVASGSVLWSAGKVLHAFGLVTDDAAGKATVSDSASTSDNAFWTLRVSGCGHEDVVFNPPVWCACGVHVTLTGASASAMVLYSGGSNRGG